MYIGSPGRPHSRCSLADESTQHRVHNVQSKLLHSLRTAHRNAGLRYSRAHQAGLPSVLPAASPAVLPDTRHTYRTSAHSLSRPAFLSTRSGSRLEDAVVAVVTICHSCEIPPISRRCELAKLFTFLIRRSRSSCSIIELIRLIVIRLIVIVANYPLQTASDLQ